MKKLILISIVLLTMSCKKENLYNIPNAITPNGDGINDTWVIPFDGANVIIYNRLGATVFYSDSYNQKFSGLGYNETFYYIINSKFTGSITVIK